VQRTRQLGDRIGDRLLLGVTALAAATVLAIVAAIVWRIADGAWPAIRTYHLAFLWHDEWNPVTSQFGARDFVIGTVVTSFGAMLLAGPLSVAIALFLSELAPPAVRGPIGTLVELLAAVPSVVVGLWGIYVLAPFAARHVAPLLGGGETESTVFAAILVLAIMTVPITSAICRELFLAVPAELEEGAVALGATRWETVRTIVVPSVRGGVVAAIVLGLGRALGEAIAVTQVIGNFVPLRGLFAPGDTIASRLANQFAGASTNIQISSLVYLGLILLAITFVTNYAAQRVVKRFALA
jgi:phosphate transport system permease protein